MKLSIPRPLNEELLNCDGDPELGWTVGMGTKIRDCSTTNNKRPFDLGNLDLALSKSYCQYSSLKMLLLLINPKPCWSAPAVKRHMLLE